MLLFGATRTDQADLDRVYIDAPVRGPDGIRSLARTLRRHPRLVLTGVGGSGKTTLVHKLCLDAAEAETPDRVPLIVYARDIGRASPAGPIETFILHALRRRFDVPMPDGVLPEVLRRFAGLVIIDGLDEAGGAQRRHVTAQVADFAGRWPDIPVLVTTRPYGPIAEELPGFTVADLPAWTHDLMLRYAACLNAVGLPGSRVPAEEQIRRVEGLDLAEVFGTPLVQQILAIDAYPERDLHPQAFGELVGTHLLNSIIASREMIRLEDTLGQGQTLRLLERVAYRMQSDPAQRTAITATRVRAEVVEMLGDDAHRDADRVMNALDHARAFLTPQPPTAEGVKRFTFIHTLYREYLASAHLAGLPVTEIAEAVVAHGGDPAWEPVLRLTVGAVLNAGDETREKLTAELRRRAPGSEDLIAAPVRSLPGRPRGREGRPGSGCHS